MKIECTGKELIDILVKMPCSECSMKKVCYYRKGNNTTNDIGIIWDACMGIKEMRGVYSGRKCVL